MGVYSMLSGLFGSSLLKDKVQLVDTHLELRDEVLGDDEYTH